MSYKILVHTMSCKHTHTHTHAHTHTHTHTHKHTHTHSHKQTHSHMHTCTHACTHAHMHTCTHMICAHTYTTPTYVWISGFRRNIHCGGNICTTNSPPLICSYTFVSIACIVIQYKIAQCHAVTILVHK